MCDPRSTFCRRDPGRAVRTGPGLAAALAFVLVAQPVDLAGQADAGPRPEAAVHRISWGLQLAWDQARDDLLVPLRWSGLGFGLRLDWSRTGARGRHDTGLLLPFSIYHNKFGHAGYALGIEAGYAYVRRLSGPGTHGSFALGGRLGWDLYDGFYESWDEEHAYWFSSLWLGPRLAWSGALGRDARLTLDLPLVAGVARPPRYRLNKTDPLTRLGFHLVDTQKGMTFAAAPDFAALLTGLTMPVRRGSAVRLSYEFAIATVSHPARVITMSHRITVSHGRGR